MKRRTFIAACAIASLCAGPARAQQTAFPPPPPLDPTTSPSAVDDAEIPVVQAFPPRPREAATPSLLSPVGSSVARRPRAFWRDRLRILNATLPPLAERSRDSRRVEILTNTIAGAVTIGLGFIFAPDTGSEPHPAQVLLWTQGGILLAQGLASLAIPPARERLSDEFAALPQSTARERRARVRFGEEALDRMAADGARRRVIFSVVGAVAAFVPMFVLYRDQIFDGQPWPEPAVFNVLAFSVTGLAAVQALVPIFSRSNEERLRDEYRTRLRMLREGAEDPD